jgi:4-diphosphocytidyl-2-C-methyl-D-erythritol kinase
MGDISVLTIEANAKINLALDVLGKRPDGYHQVEMIMQSVSLSDTVTLTETAREIAVTANDVRLPCGSDNLAYRAAALLRDTLHIDRGVAIHLEKRIPIAAGLAGGSSNAAAVLKGLNHLWSLGLSTEQLMKLGAQLGSDVPFCIVGGTMRAYGRGELLETLPAMPQAFVVLAKPPVGVSTAWVYGNYRAAKVNYHPDIAGMIACLGQRDYDGVASRLCNVLESVTIPAYPAVAQIKQLMSDCGAASLMSGSGPTVFGLVSDRVQAEKIAIRLRNEVKAQVYVAETVTKVGDENGEALIANKTR